MAHWCKARLSANCKRDKKGPLCDSCWRLCDEQQAEEIKQAHNLEQPEEQNEEAWKFCSARGCWEVVKKTRYNDPLPFCKRHDEPVPVRSRSRSWSTDHVRPSRSFLCKEEAPSRSRSRSPRQQTTQAVQGDAKMAEMKLVQHMGNIVQKHMANMQAEMDKFLTYVEDVIAKGEGEGEDFLTYVEDVICKGAGEDATASGSQHGDQ